MGQRKRKKSKRGSSLSETKEVMAAMASNGDDNMYNDLQNSLDCLRQVVSERFVKLHTDLDKLQFEFKTEIEAVKISIKDIEKSLTYTHSEVEGLKEHLEMEMKEHSKEVDTLNKKITDLDDGLKQEVQNKLYALITSRRRNCRAVVYNILEKELGVYTTKIRFHAVHPVGKKSHGRRTPTIVRFVCREDQEKFGQ